jgi:hypothetical protein
MIDEQGREKYAKSRQKFFPLEEFLVGASLSCYRTSSVSLDISCRVTSLLFTESNYCAIYARFFFVLEYFFSQLRKCAEKIFFSFIIFLRKVIRALDVCSASGIQLCVFSSQYGKNAKICLISSEQEQKKEFAL